MSVAAAVTSFKNLLIGSVRCGMMLPVIAIPLSLLPADSVAQQLDVGAYAVFGDMRYPVPNSAWGSWIRDTSADNSGRADAIPSERWEQLRDLGVTLAHVTVFPDAVRDDDRNVALRLSRAAHARGLRLMLTDGVIRNLGEGERRLVHPESFLDFPERRAGIAVHSPAAERDALGCDRHLLEKKRENALLLLPSRDAGTNLRNRGCGGVRVQGSNGASSGRYVLSLRLAPIRLPEVHTDKAVLSVLLRAGSDTLRFTLGSMEIADACRSTPGAAVELALGEVHFYVKENGEATVRAVRDTGNALNARTAVGDTELFLEYHGGVPLLLDAICLSDARSYALFNPTDDRAEHHGLEEDVRNRLRLLGADSTAPWPALAYLEFAESLPWDASWPVGRKLAAMLREAAGLSRQAVRLFTYTSGEASLDPARIREAAVMMLGTTSGFYSYPFQEAFRATPRDAWYYDSTYTPVPWERGGRNTWTNLVHLPLWYRLYAEQRRDAGGVDWMPAIQNHSWLFRNGWPVSPIMDTTWLREPTTLELRFNCNLALAYGARGLMFYSFSSWPGLATKPVVRKRTDSQYGDMGCIGFLDPHTHEPRRMDTNGENKWDSTRNSILKELRPAGDILAALQWTSGASMEAGLAGGLADVVTSAVTRPFGRRDADEPDRRFLEITVFSDPADSAATVLFILNKRVDARGGRRVEIALHSAFIAQPAELFPGGRLRSWDTSARALTVDLPPASAVIVRLGRR
jgi:hypothetical protein